MSARYNPRKEHNVRRRAAFKQPKKTFLIVCEGENTEPEYFNAFRLTSATVKAVGKGLGTTSLVREAIAIRDEAARRGKTFDFCWVVFDKDDYNDFDEAIILAQENGFSVAYSNQAFELWFLLHFKAYRGALDMTRYGSLLTKHLGVDYSKRSGFAATLYNILKPLQDVAIRNAKSLQDEMKDIKPSMAESSTRVHELVMQLNEFVD